jgi:hypothetical protein
MIRKTDNHGNATRRPLPVGGPVGGQTHRQDRNVVCCAPFCSAMRVLILFCLALLWILPAIAQPEAASVEGITVRQGWPHRALNMRRARSLGVLPAMDTLALGYRVVPTGARPGLDVAFRWTPGAWGILDGQRVPYSRLPEGLRLVAFVLTADVMQAGRRVAGFSFEVDSTRLAAGDVLRVSPQAPWGRLFDGTSAAEARRIVEEGFTLDNLRLVRAAFAVYERDGRRSSRRAERRPSHRTVVVLDEVIEATWHLGWLFDDTHRWDQGVTRPADKEDPEGDDDEQLLPAALTGLATVAAVAYAGGTGGFYGAGGAPLGLAAGRTGRSGGVLAQVGVNLGVLGARNEPERLQVRLVGYRTGMRSPVGPFVGAGVEAREAVLCRLDAPCEATDGLRFRGLLSAGLALRAGRIVLLGGAELVRGRPEFGVVFRMR